MSVVKRNLFLLAAAASRCPTMLKSVFRIKSLFFCSLIFLCIFLKNKRTRRIKIASSLLRFLTRKRTGYGAEPRKRGTGLCPGRGVRGGTPEKNYFANSRLFSKPFCTAFMQAERKPFPSKAATPATVVPPGEQTLSFNCSG